MPCNLHMIRFMIVFKISLSFRNSSLRGGHFEVVGLDSIIMSSLAPYFGNVLTFELCFTHFSPCHSSHTIRPI